MTLFIETERLILRPPVLADEKAVFEWASDDRVSKYTAYTTYTSIEQVKKWLEFGAGGK